MFSQPLCERFCGGWGKWLRPSFTQNLTLFFHLLKYVVKCHKLFFQWNQWKFFSIIFQWNQQWKFFSIFFQWNQQWKIFRFFFIEFNSGIFFSSIFCSKSLKPKNFTPMPQPTLVIFLSLLYLLSNVKDKSHVMFWREEVTRG